MKRLIKKIFEILFCSLFYLFPIKKNKILFSSFYGRGYGDNLKYIAEALNRRTNKDTRFEMLWVISRNDEASSLPDFIKPVCLNSIKYFYHIMTSAIWVDNCRKPIVFKKKKQFYIQTWHGGGAQKKAEGDVTEKLSKGYVKMAKKDSKHIDLFLSESHIMTQIYQRSYWYDGPIYECGYPRFDPIINCDNEIKRKVFDYFGLDYNLAIALYAPTFRSNKSLGAYDVDFERFRTNLKKRFAKDFVVLIRLHPNVADKSVLIVSDNIFDATFYPDVQELLVAADVLLGDYSSVNYDFCLKKSPVFRYAKDLNEYANDRDFYLKTEDYPFPIAMNNDELEELILNYDQIQYEKKLTEFFDKIGAILEFGASNKVSNIIIDYCSIFNKKAFFEKNACKFIFK